MVYIRMYLKRLQIYAIARSDCVKIFLASTYCWIDNYCWRIKIHAK